MNETLSIENLAAEVNAWCQKRRVTPASGQVGSEVNERNIRFYRTLGLIDAPAGGLQGYGEKHRLQLIGIRLLQAKGLPLRKIRELLYGRSLDELREIEKRGLEELENSPTPTAWPAEGELWRMLPLNEEFTLISRRGATLSSAQREAILAVLESPSPRTHRKTSRSSK